MFGKLVMVCLFVSALALAAPAFSDPAASALPAADAAVVTSEAEAAAPAEGVAQPSEAAAAGAEAEAPVVESDGEFVPPPPPPARSAVSEAAAINAAANAAGAAALAASEEAQRLKIANAPRTFTVPSSESKTIGAAMAAARPGDTVKVKDGRYREVIFVTPGVTLKAENRFKAVLDGRGRNTIVTMGTASVISGFEIRNGVIGVFSASGQAAINQCRIIQNIQSGIMCVGVLPRIEDNIIAFNKGSGIQGWDVRTVSGSINHNTIVFNANHGIALGGNTSITVENNIIAFNDQFGLKPGEETVRVDLINNNLYQNAKMSSALPSDNISSDPLFTDSKRLNFSLRKESRSIGQGNDNQDLGARITN